jgi:methionyl-tRNA formyltransferase
VRVGLIGRTRWLLAAAELALQDGHEIAFICTTPDASGGAGVEDFRSFAEPRGIPLHIGTRLSHLDLDAEVCLSVNWVTVLRRPFLERFEHGVLNAHAGDLPRYRGNATLNWAILNGERQACLTVHRMVEELDAGPIALKVYRPILPDDDMTTLSAWLDQVVPESLVAAVNGLREGTLRFTLQDPSIRPLRVYPRRPEDSRIDWRASAEEVVRLVRASAPPFAGARTELDDGREVIVIRARRVVPDFDFLAVAGQVCFVSDGNPVVAAGDGMVEIVECVDDEATKGAILSSLRNRLR